MNSRTAYAVLRFVYFDASIDVTSEYAIELSEWNSIIEELSPYDDSPISVFVGSSTQKITIEPPVLSKIEVKGCTRGFYSEYIKLGCGNGDVISDIVSRLDEHKYRRYFAQREQEFYDSLSSLTQDQFNAVCLLQDQIRSLELRETRINELMRRSLSLEQLTLVYEENDEIKKAVYDLESRLQALHVKLGLPLTPHGHYFLVDKEKI